VNVIQIEELPHPVLAPGCVVLDVKAAALNHLDIWVRRGGRFQLKMPHVLGTDAAGVVAAVAPDVSGVRVGDEVVLYPGVFCGTCEHCLRGQQSLCNNLGLVGAAGPGTFAQQICVPAVCVHPRPAYLSWQEASTLAVDHLTAWRMLVTRAQLQPGETVLIHGIGGGCALAGLQIAKLAGARVIVTSSSEDKLARAAKLGADATINYAATPGVAERVRELTGGRGVDVVFDTVGTATWETNFNAVRRGGRIVLCGVTTGATAEVNIQALYWNQISVLGSTMGSRAEFQQLLLALSAAKVKPVVDSVVPLDKVREATSRLEAGKQFGKIVLNIS
jgi:NADPH:quinone reductase-like Zn-dependent oxidoreductase